MHPTDKSQTTDRQRALLLLWGDDPEDHPLVRAFRAERQDVVFLGFGGRVDCIHAALDRILETANKEIAECKAHE